MKKLVTGAPVKLTGYLRFPEAPGWMTPAENRDKRLRQAFGECRDQLVLGGPALQLPGSERDEGRSEEKREQRKAGHARLARDIVHFVRSISRPGAALWWNCRAISSDFIARSGNSVVARISGSQSSACSQNGG